MFVSTDPRRLIDAVLELVDVAGVNDLPQLRVGVATGLAVSRAWDWFGRPVNVANRVAGLAKPRTVLVTGPARQSTGVSADSSWTPTGAHELRGVSDRVELFRVRAAKR